MKSTKLMCITVMALFATLAILVPLAAQQQVQDKQKPLHYVVIDLGTLGGTFSQAFGINNEGSVVGYATTPGDTALHAFLWRNGLMTDLGTFGGPISQAISINERGEIVGVSETNITDPLGEDFCGFGDHLVCVPFIWRVGVMNPLPTLGGTNGAAVGINNRGEVLGFAENSTPDPTCLPPEVLHFEPVIWNNGNVQQLPTFPGDPDGIATAINDPGEATLPTGNCAFLGPPSGHDSLFRRGTLTDFGTFGGFPIAANDLNNRGQVVGVTAGPSGTEIEAVLWQNGAAIGLGTLPGDTVSIGSAINDSGQVTGQSCDANGNCRGFLWQDGVMTDLNTLVPADSTLVFPDPVGINPRGQIVGLGVQKSTGELHGFLLTPRNGEVGDENAAAAAPGNISERPQVVLPENVRRALQHHLGRRYHIPGVGTQLQK
jgi:probable HAF family extracellular repeat protein